MFKFNFVRRAVAAALALTMAATSVGPALAWPWQGPEDLGVRTSMISESDTITKKEVVAVTAPGDNKAAVGVKQTVHYEHSRFLNNSQLYRIQKDGTAEFVDRLGYWMYKDSEAKLFRFSKGSKVGIETARSTIDVGARSSVMGANDSGYISGVTAGAVSADGSTRTLNVTRRYTHAEVYNDVSYTIASTDGAVYVSSQNAHMQWIGSTLYKVDLAGNVQALREKPLVNIGVRASKISGNDSFVSGPHVSAGQVSFNGQTRAIIVSRDYDHEETFERQRYSIRTDVTATYVKEQNAHMVWIENTLYKVRVGSNDVVSLRGRPSVDMGERISKMSYSDPLKSVLVTPVSLTSDNRAIIVSVRHFYTHTETYQVKEYYTQTNEVARYNDTYRVWTVIVDGRIYAIAFADDVVSNSGPDVVIIKAPDGFKKPNVVVVPGGDGPPVVVPTGKNKPSPADEDGPPVVVPSAKKKGPVVIQGDDDGPAVVVPRR